MHQQTTGDVKGQEQVVQQNVNPIAYPTVNTQVPQIPAPQPVVQVPNIQQPIAQNQKFSNNVVVPTNTQPMDYPVTTTDQEKKKEKVKKCKSPRCLLWCCFGCCFFVVCTCVCLVLAGVIAGGIGGFTVLALYQKCMDYHNLPTFTDTIPLANITTIEIDSIGTFEVLKATSASNERIEIEYQYLEIEETNKNYETSYDNGTVVIKELVSANGINRKYGNTICSAQNIKIFIYREDLVVKSKIAYTNKYSIENQKLKGLEIDIKYGAGSNIKNVELDYMKTKLSYTMFEFSNFKIHGDLEITQRYQRAVYNNFAVDGNLNLNSRYSGTEFNNFNVSGMTTLDTEYCYTDIEYSNFNDFNTKTDYGGINVESAAINGAIDVDGSYSSSNFKKITKKNVTAEGNINISKLNYADLKLENFDIRSIKQTGELKYSRVEIHLSTANLHNMKIPFELSESQYSHVELHGKDKMTLESDVKGFINGAIDNNKKIELKSVSYSEVEISIE